MDTNFHLSPSYFNYLFSCSPTIINILPIEIILKYWDNKEDGRKSIPYSEFLENAHEIKINYHPRLDYLKVIDELFFK